jgi:hypothetical protein
MTTHKRFSSGNHSEHEIRGSLLQVLNLDGNKCGIVFRVVKQTAVKAFGTRVHSMEYSIVMLESLISKTRSSIPYQSILQGVRDGHLIIYTPE